MSPSIYIAHDYLKEREREIKNKSLIIINQNI
jgi:hypothetical protein